MSKTEERAEIEALLEEVEPHVVQRDEDSVTYRLIDPVELGGVTFETVTVRRPKIKDFAQANHKNQTIQAMNLVSILCAIPFKAVEQFEPEDFANVALLAVNFPPRSRATGKSSSQI